MKQQQTLDDEPSKQVYKDYMPKTETITGLIWEHCLVQQYAVVAIRMP